MKPYEFAKSNRNASAQRRVEAYMESLDELLPVMRHQADATVEALAAARARVAERFEVRSAVRAELRQHRDRGLG